MCERYGSKSKQSAFKVILICVRESIFQCFKSPVTFTSRIKYGHCETGKLSQAFAIKCPVYAQW
ncbi:unnamed protein product [Bathycoccus prasinos]